MSVVRKSILTIVGTGILTASNLAIGVLLARWLSPAGLGQYALLASAGTLLGIVGSMGMGGASIYYVNTRGMEQSRATTVVVRSATMIAAVLAVLAAVIVRHEDYFGALPALAAVAVGFMVLGKVIIPATMYLLIAAMRVLAFVVVQVMPTVALLAFVGVLALLERLTLGPALWSAAAGQILGVLILFMLVRRDYEGSRPFRWSELSPLLRYGVLINLAHFVYVASTDGGVFLVRLFTPGFDEVGFYQAALRASSIVVMAVMAVGPLLFSKYSAADDATRPLHVERTSRVFWVAVLGMVAVLELVSSPLILLLFGQEFEQAVLVLQIMLPGMAARALVQPMLQMFYSTGAAAWVVAVLGFNVMVMTVGMYLLVPPYAAAGAAVAFTAASVVSLVFGYAVATSRFGVRLKNCFLITHQDVRFLITNLRSAPSPMSSS